MLSKELCATDFRLDDVLGTGGLAQGQKRGTKAFDLLLQTEGSKENRIREEVIVERVTCDV